jgi:citrate synthase
MRRAPRRKFANNIVPATAFKTLRAPRRAGERDRRGCTSRTRGSMGFMNTSVTTSAITFIDGEAGIEHISFSDAL